jgi:DNA replication protein DnaC
MRQTTSESDERGGPVETIGGRMRESVPVSWTCPTCRVKTMKDFPRIVAGIIEKGSVECETCEAKRKAEEAEREKAKTKAERGEGEETAEARFRELCPPLFRDTDPDRLPAEALARVLPWRPGDDGQGLVIVGPVGSGKTRALFLLIRELLRERHEVEVFTGTGFGGAAGRAYAEGPESGELWLDRLARVEVLAIDDLPKLALTPRAEASLFAVLDERMNWLRPTLVTTDVTGDALAARMSACFAAGTLRRLREANEIIPFPSRAAGPSGPFFPGGGDAG